MTPPFFIDNILQNVSSTSLLKKFKFISNEILICSKNNIFKNNLFNMPQKLFLIQVTKLVGSSDLNRLEYPEAADSVRKIWPHPVEVFRLGWVKHRHALYPMAGWAERSVGMCCIAGQVGLDGVCSYTNLALFSLLHSPLTYQTVVGVSGGYEPMLPKLSSSF
jgi:hypothetical protein